MQIKRMENESKLKKRTSTKPQSVLQVQRQPKRWREKKKRERYRDEAPETHRYRNEERAKRRPRSKCRRNTVPWDHTDSCTGCALNKSKECHFFT